MKKRPKGDQFFQKSLLKEDHLEDIGNLWVNSCTNISIEYYSEITCMLWDRDNKTFLDEATTEDVKDSLVDIQTHQE